MGMLYNNSCLSSRRKQQYANKLSNIFERSKIKFQLQIFDFTQKINKL